MKHGLVFAGLTFVYLLSVISAVNGNTNATLYALPANIIITNMSLLSSNVTLHSPVRLFLTLMNDGQLASGYLNLNVRISSIAYLNYTFNATPLSPLQRENITITLINATEFNSAYNVAASVYYTKSGSKVSSNTRISNYTVAYSTQIANYTSYRPTYAALQIPQLLITELPLYETFDSSSRISTMGFENTGSAPELVFLKVSKPFSNLLSVSAGTVYLNPYQDADVNLLFQLQPNARGTFVIPINITVLYKNSTSATQTYFLTFAAVNPVNIPSAYSELDLINYNYINGVVTIHNPSNSTFGNVSADTYLPIGAVSSISNIKTSGIISNITQQQGSYVIHWNVGLLPPHQTVYAYYTLNNLQNQNLLNDRARLLTMPLPASRTNVLKVVNPTIPTLYTNSTGAMNISALYTGIQRQQISFIMTAPPGTVILNSTQNITALPNQFITKRFVIKTGASAGTVILNLYIQTKGANYSFYLPEVVTGAIGQQQVTTTAQSNGAVSQLNILNYASYIIAAIFLILIILLIVRVRRSMQVSRYRRDREGHLLRIKKGIQLEGSDGK